MHVTRDEIEAYAIGELDDPVRCKAVKLAIEDDPQAAAWYGDICSRLEPAPEGAEGLRKQFHKIDQSIWVPVRWNDEAPGGHGSLEFEDVANPKRAELDVKVSDALLAVELKRVPVNLRPASLVAFCPTTVRQLTLGTMRPVRLANYPVLSARSIQTQAAEYALAAKQSHEMPREQQFEQTDGRGFAAWLQGDRLGATYLCCQVLTSNRMARVGRYQFHAPAAPKPSLERRFDLTPAASTELLTSLRSWVASGAAALNKNRPATVPSDPSEDGDILKLVETLRDPYSADWLRADCAKALGDSTDRQVRTVLIQSLQDDDNDRIVRTACASALCQIADAESVKGLLETHDDSDAQDWLQKACREALARRFQLLTCQAEIEGWKWSTVAASMWKLDITLGDPRDGGPLSTDELRSLPHDDLTVIPLDAIAGNDPAIARYSATVRESQRAVWCDPAAVQLVQFERTPMA